MVVSTLRQIVLTRTPEDNQNLVRALQAIGLTVVEHPCVRFQYLNFNESRLPVGRHLENYDAIVFTSKRAVDCLIPFKNRLEKLACLFAGVGKATKRHMESNLGITPSIVSPLQTGKDLANLLIKIMTQTSSANSASKAETGKRSILYFCGNLTTLEFETPIMNAGIQLDKIAVYQNLEPETLPPEIKKPSIVVIASPSAGDRFLQNNQYDAGHLVYIAIGPVTEAFLKNRGVSGIHISERPDDDSIFKAILSLLQHEKCNRKGSVFPNDKSPKEV